MSLVAKSPYFHFRNDAGTSVYHGRSCPRDGTTLRYSKGNKCIACSLDKSGTTVKPANGVVLSPPLHLINRAWA